MKNKATQKRSIPGYRGVSRLENGDCGAADPNQMFGIGQAAGSPSPLSSHGEGGEAEVLAGGLIDFGEGDGGGGTDLVGALLFLDRLAQSLVLFRPNPGAKQPDDHNTSLWLVDAQGELRMRYSGNPPDVPRLLREMTLL